MEQLHEHVLLHKLFFKPTSDEIAACREEIRHRGHPRPLDILPDGTVVSGQKWLVAAKLEGRRDVDVIVRQDLSDRGEAAVVEEAIVAKLRHGNISDIEKAACYLVFRQSCSQYLKSGVGDVRDRIAEQLNLGLCGRQLDRLVPLLKLPEDIRRAIAKKRISKTAGMQLLRLPIEPLLQIAAEIAAGASFKQIRTRYGLNRSRDDASPQAQLNGLNGILRDLAERLVDDESELVISAVNAAQLVESADQLVQILSCRHRTAPGGTSTKPTFPRNVAIRRVLDSPELPPTKADQSGK